MGLFRRHRDCVGARPPLAERGVQATGEAGPRTRRGARRQLVACHREAGSPARGAEVIGFGTAGHLIGRPVKWPAVPKPITSADRKSTRLNSSHQIISYAVFCLKK